MHLVSLFVMYEIKTHCFILKVVKIYFYGDTDDPIKRRN